MFTPETCGINIVALGVFDLAQFLPHALNDAKLLSDQEVTAAKIEVFVPKIELAFDVEWARIQVKPTQLIVETSKTPYIRACDLAIGAIRGAESLISAFGFNYMAHYNLGSPAKRDAIGRRLAPISAWGTWTKDLSLHLDTPADSELHPGMVSITMREARDKDRVCGHIDTTVQPSGLVKAKAGIFIAVNDHYAGANPTAADAAPVSAEMTTQLLDQMQLRFDESIKRSISICDGIIGMAT